MRLKIAFYDAEMWVLQIVDEKQLKVLKFGAGEDWRSRIFADRNSALFKTLKPLIELRSSHTVLPVCLVKQLK